MKLNDFNPVRLKSARLYRGKIVDILAKETNINKKDIIAFEESKYLPKLENASKLADALDFPIEYFYQKDNMKVLVDSAHFAVPGSIPRVEEVAFREMLIMTHKICKFIDEYVTLPKLNLPKEVGRNIDAEILANALREYWNLGDKPIDDLQSIMEENGIIISTINKGKKGTTPFTQKQSIDDELRYFVCIGDDLDSLPRRNFDLAYELGYIVGNMLNIPVKAFSKDEFACALLIPKESFIKDLENPCDINSYIGLKKKYNAPITALLFRANTLGVLGYKAYNNMGSQMQKLGWLNKEPLDNEIKAQMPKLLTGTVRALIDKDILTKGNISQRLSSMNIDIKEEDINILLGLQKPKVIETNMNTSFNKDKVQNKKASKNNKKRKK